MEILAKKIRQKKVLKSDCKFSCSKKNSKKLFFGPKYWPLFFDNFWKKIEKNSSKKWLKNVSKNPVTQNSQKYILENT